MRKVAIVTARNASKRLPNKMLADINGKPLLWWTLKKVRQIKGLTDFVVATTLNDNEIAEWCKANYVKCYQGSEDDILDRLYCAAFHNIAEVIIRVWGSCPLFDPKIPNLLLDHILDGEEYVYNTGYPGGHACAVLTFERLKKDWKPVKDPKDREWYHEYSKKNAYEVKNKTDYSHVNLDVDTQEDLDLMRCILEI